MKLFNIELNLAWVAGISTGIIAIIAVIFFLKSGSSKKEEAPSISQETALQTSSKALTTVSGGVASPVALSAATPAQQAQAVQPISASTSTAASTAAAVTPSVSPVDEANKQLESSKSALGQVYSRSTKSGKISEEADKRAAILEARAERAERAAKAKAEKAAKAKAKAEAARLQAKKQST